MGRSDLVISTIGMYHENVGKLTFISYNSCSLVHHTVYIRL